MGARLITIAAVLCLGISTAEAGTATWHFVEDNDGSPGPIGASLTLNAPPVNLTPGVAWTAVTADFVDFRILDPAIGPVGPYNINRNVASILEGIGPNFINIHEVSGQDASGNVAFSDINGNPGASDLGVALVNGGFASVTGDWVLVPAAVPEPSSSVLTAVALVGMGAWLRRQRAR
jgi:hypothetical protein